MFNILYFSNIIIPNIITKNQFSYVKQYLLEQEEAEKLEKVSMQHHNVQFIIFILMYIMIKDTIVFK